MAKPKLWKLNPLDFTKLNPTRQEKIAQAPAAKLPEAASYKPNQIAAALHPGVQHLKVARVAEEAANCKTY